MTPKFIFFQASFSSVLLRSVALAIVFVASASSTLAAGPVTLTCRTEPGTETQTLRIDYATGMVEQLSPSGKPYTNRIAPNARISENAIVWSVELMDTGLQTPRPMKWEGTIDRLSGTGSTSWSRAPDWQSYRVSLTCRQATQKF